MAKKAQPVLPLFYLVKDADGKTLKVGKCQTEQEMWRVAERVLAENAEHKRVTFFGADLTWVNALSRPNHLQSHPDVLSEEDRALLREAREASMTALMVQARKANKDVGRFIAAALSTAANELDGVEALVAGRPGSWEADIVKGMAYAGEVSIQEDVEQLAELFIEMGRAREDGGDVLSQAISAAVDEMGGLDAFAGGGMWYEDLTNLGRQYSRFWDV